MLTTEPKLDYRPEQSYMGIRVQVPMSDLPVVIPKLIIEVFGWLRTHQIAPTGAPFNRFYVIDMPDRLDIEIGVPVASPQSGDDRVRSGSLLAGRYGSLIYTGIENGIAGNAKLLDWGTANGLQWDRWETEQGDAFACRYESNLTDPANEPDPTRWETEVAIRIRD